jgi:hypothetical protein
MPLECVIDTSVLQKANAPISTSPGVRSLFLKRLKLLSMIQTGDLVVLISKQLHSEYGRQVRSPRNDYVRAFFDLLDNPARRIYNWEKHWAGKRGQARSCRFPSEDDHVLRTAIRPHSTTIFSEEERMLAADACIYRKLRVHIWHP